MRRRALIGVLASVTLGSVGVASAKSPMSSQMPAKVIWQATQESGTYSAWASAPGHTDCGGHADSGGTTVIDSTRAHTGAFSLLMTVTAPLGGGDVGTRNFKWCGPNGKVLPAEAVYSAWFYLDQEYKPAQWWNIFQFKTRTAYNWSDPDWTLNIYRNSKGMGLYWFDKDGLGRRGNSGAGSFNPGVWHHVEVLYRFSPMNGQIIAWLDGHKWYSRNHVPTERPNAFKPNERQWSVNNYTNGITPSTARIWVDDASISYP